jgi:sugar O-acyltransferase (sialic acid O-acetyltransferase NeuD family)
MLIYGCGGHAAVVRSVLLSQRESITAVFDDNAARHSFIETCVLHNYNPAVLPGEKLIITIGDNAARRAVAEKVKHAFGNAIHPSALIDDTVSIKNGTVILHRAIVQANVKIGAHCIVNSGAIVEHDCRVEDFVHIAPGAILCGGVVVGEGTLIGAGSVVNPGIQIGKNCVIGAGSVVIRHIPDFAVAVGNPARISKIYHTQ